ncbi:MAG: condensation domain-containing protein [Granulosicoccus sp.]
MDRENIESIVPLLPMQQSFLWHSLKERQLGGVIQLTCRLSGDMDLPTLESAWCEVINHHQALRSTVHWQGVPSPVQIVHRQVEQSLEVLDISVFPTLEAFLQHDQLQALDLAIPVPHRLAIYPASDESCHVIWTMSHVLLDGWSSAVVVNEWVTRYTLMRQGKPGLESAPLPLTDHSRWIKHQDADQLQQFWNSCLPEKYNVDPLPFQQSADTDRQHKAMASAQAELSVDEFSALMESVRVAGISLNTVLQVCFATLLHTRGSDKPVVFTTTVSGRHIDIAEVDKRVGMLMNMIPICVHFEKDKSVAKWLRRQQDAFFACLPYAHASPQQIATLRPHNKERYRSLLVVESQPSVLSTEALDVTEFRSDIVSEFDLTLAVIPAQSLLVELRYDTCLFRAEDIDRLLGSLIDMLSGFVQLLERPVSALETYKWEDLPEVAIVSAKAAASESHTQISTHKPALTEPSSVLPQMLHEIWCDVLERTSVDTDTSFFDLGGTSMQAVMMFELIESRLQCRLPATSLFTASSIALLAEYIESVNPELAASDAVVINSGGTQPPLFIPFEQVDMLIYQQILSELGKDQPVYGLPIPLQAYSSLEVLETLARQIQQICPTGAVRLAGLSGAGHIAWELAQRLAGLNREVDLLVLLDSFGPDFPHLQPPFARLLSVGGKFMLYEAKTMIRFGQQFWLRVSSGLRKTQTPQTPAMPDQNRQTRHVSDEFARLTVEEITRGAEFLRELSPRCSRFERLVNALVLTMCGRHMQGVGLQMELIAFLQGLLLQHHKGRLHTNNAAEGALNDETAGGIDGNDTLPATQFLIRRYRQIYAGLDSYNGRVLLCRAKRRPAGLVFDPFLGWEDYLTEDAQVSVVPGDHRTLLKRPNVRYLVDAIQAQCAGS